MSLSDTQCRAAKPREKLYKVFDGEGLYLEVLPTGAKSWRLKYSFLGKEGRLSFGKYPEISLGKARQLKIETRELIGAGVNPALYRKEQNQIAIYSQAVSFESIAREWHEKQIGHWSQRHANTILYRLEKYLFSEIGEYPISSIKPLVLLSCLQKIDKTAPEMARRTKRICSHIFKYAIATGRVETDPSYGLESALRKYKRGHYASITVDEFPEFIVALNNYKHQVYRQTYLALQLMLLTFVRTSELIQAKWSEIDFENAMWVIPADRMKMGLPHMVPLATQALEIFKELKELNGKREHVFPSIPRPRKPMSNNTILMALKRMGYKHKMTGHGFRSLALGLLKEKLNIPHHIADRQLAHVPKGSVDRAYDRAQFLSQRIEMMQAYADYIDTVYLKSLPAKSFLKIDKKNK